MKLQLYIFDCDVPYGIHKIFVIAANEAEALNMALVEFAQSIHRHSAEVPSLSRVESREIIRGVAYVASHYE